MICRNHMTHNGAPRPYLMTFFFFLSFCRSDLRTFSGHFCHCCYGHCQPCFTTSFGNGQCLFFEDLIENFWFPPVRTLLLCTLGNSGLATRLPDTKSSADANPLENHYRTTADHSDQRSLQSCAPDSRTWVFVLVVFTLGKASLKGWKNLFPRVRCWVKLVKVTWRANVYPPSYSSFHKTFNSPTREPG